MRYSTLLFDLDHTLLDSDASELAAYQHAMGTIGLTDAAAHFDRYVAINREMWALVEQGAMDPNEVRTRRFERFTAELGIRVDPLAMAEAFVWALGAHGDLYEGAHAVLAELADRATLAMVTNGLSDVQRARIERLDIGRYFAAVVISSEVGVTKPRSEIFDVAFELLGSPAKETSVMIGDSLTSDIRGGADYGIATCWYNPNGKTAGPDDVITHQVAALSELPQVI